VKYKIAVIGTGSWGTALACAVARNGHQVVIWGRNKELCDAINTKHENITHLNGYPLPESLVATNDLSFAVCDTDIIILASPSLYLKETVNLLLNTLPFQEDIKKVPTIGVLTKGFMPNSDGEPQFIIETLEKMLPPSYSTNLVYISGPSHGEEVVMGAMTGLIAASSNPMASIRCREALKSKSLLVYSSLDIIGVQVCAALKNVIAIAFGVLDALSEETDIFGDNTRSLLLAAGLNEIQSIGATMGATHAETFTSIAGVGDLEVTCRSKYGRNRRFGYEIVKNNLLAPYKNIDELIVNISNIGYLPEGVMACNYVHKIAIREGLKLPICSGIYKILNKEMDAQNYIEQIMNGEV